MNTETQAPEVSENPNNMKGASTVPIAWIDCEMTGLDPQVDELVEIAVIVTDADLKPLDPGIEMVIKPSDTALEQMSEFVRNMHVESGLLDRLDGGIPLHEAEGRVLEYLKEFIPEDVKAPLAGNSVGQDQRFLRRYMPKVTDVLSYRIIDVSSIKELAKRWYPRVYVCSPEKMGGHRALGDIQDSIIELQYYREALFPSELDPKKGFYHDLAAQVGEAGQFD